MKKDMKTTNDQARTSYYWTNGQRVGLVQEPRVFSLKMAAGKAPLSPEAVDILRQRTDPLLFIDAKGMNVYETDAETQQRALRILNGEDAVVFATPAFRRSPESDELMFVTDEFLVQFKADLSREQIDAINARRGTRIVETLDYASNAFKLEVPPNQTGTSAIEMANIYYELEPTEWAHPVIVRRMSIRSSIQVLTPERREEGQPNAPTRGARKRRDETAPAVRSGDYLSEQWHLESQHCKVIDAWGLTGAPNNGKGNRNIKIAVLDDGVDVDHPEFQSKVGAQFDFNTNTSDARPKRTQDKHGTACAGVAASSGLKAFGAAPNCELIAGRMPLFTGPDDEARMFKWACDQGADVISCSWGPPDKTGTVEPLPDAVAAAIRYCVTSGRGGKGIPIFFAAGNGNESVSTDGYASCPNVMAVAACTSQHQKAPYSDFGPEIWVCASSNGDRVQGDRSIFTVDRQGADGYNSGSAALGDAAGDYVNTFGGTSSAAPLVAGITALILSANPDLEENPNSRRQVRDILARTADKIGSGYDANGHSNQFGYGRVNARAAVDMALKMKSGGSSSGITGGTTARPSIQPVSASVSRSGSAPEFRVDPRPHPFYVVEVAARAELFDWKQHNGERNATNFFGSWTSTPFPTAPSFPVTYRLPESAWSQLKNASQLFYRLWVTDDSKNWLNEESTTGDSQAASAPCITITESGAGGTGGGSASGAGTVRYPSGVVFDIVTNPQDSVDYSDPANNGTVPLIEVAGRGEERLSANFKVKELAAEDGARYARISTELVEGLQRLRERVNTSIVVGSGYRHPALNASVGGAISSRHMSGQAADIRCGAVTPLRLAELALEELGCNIGIGLGKNGIHVDVRGRLASWVYKGAQKNEAEFDAWVSDQCAGRAVRTRMNPEIDFTPLITGPDSYRPNAMDPVSFMLEPGRGSSYQVEVATRYEFFIAVEHLRNRTIPITSETFFRSEMLDPLANGLRSTVYVLPAPAWDLLRNATRLYYRMRVVNDQGEFLSLPDDRTVDAPFVSLSQGPQFLTLEAGRRLVVALDEARRRDEELWISDATR